MSGVLLESRPFRPFKSSEEYLYAMKEDLAEWFHTLYPHLCITVENFMDRLETGVALCEHANAVKVQAHEYVQKKQARKVMTRSATGSLAQAQTIVTIADVKYFASAKPGTFFARDNVSNFIQWCRHSIQIIECLLFESDDLIMRKNEKHVILCLLEVARRGARFGMLAPMLVQMERQIDREIAADQRKLGVSVENEGQNGLVDDDDDSDSEMEDEQLMLTYGPTPQIVTNDLKSLDEMVRDLVAQCNCPTQFPMIRVSEGKYRIGDTKVLIFVRILRNHVMVRVGGGWDTLAHYLDKHDPCRCRAQHRSTQGARLVNKPGAANLVGAQVYYDRSPAAHVTDSPEKKSYLSPPSANRSRSRSPSAQFAGVDSRRSASPNLQRKSLAPPQNRSRSPTPNFTSTHITKLSHARQAQKAAGASPVHTLKKEKTPSSVVSSIQIPVNCKSEATLQVSDPSTDHSDNTSEVSDEGYRSLGVVVGDKFKNRTSVYSQNSADDAEYAEHQESIDLEDDTNDVGLRKTSFSQKIYNEPTKPPSKLPSRSNSSEAMDPPMKTRTPLASPRRSLSKPAATPNNNNNNNNTWSGKQKQPRASITPETFSPHFTRTSPTRKSIASYQPIRRTSQSANTSPTKLSLRQELISAAKKHEDDTAVIEEVHKILKQYVSQNGLDDYDDHRRSEKTYKPRKDARPSAVSRIPAPVTTRL